MSLHFTTYFLLLDRTMACPVEFSVMSNSLLSVLAKMVAISHLWSAKHTWNVPTAIEEL